jgi:hypothetical protein
MKVELKSVKINRHLSEETFCFSSELWIDGKKVGTASNRGCGGSNEIWISDRSIFKEFNEFCLSQPAVQTEYGELKMDMDLFIAELLDDYEEKQKFKRARKKTYFRLRDKTYKKGEWLVLPMAYPESMKWLLEEFGDNLGEIGNQ